MTPARPVLSARTITERLLFDEAEFSVHHDAGPPDAAFRRGARLTYQEIHYLLKYESIAVNSVLLNTRTRRPTVSSEVPMVD
jgi:hypothetical protein